MKISEIVYMLIIITFILWNPHWPPQQPQSEARLSCKQGWWPPCQFWPLQPRSWHWGRQGCYECVYWPLSQIRSTWKNLRDFNLVSWEARFLWDSGPSGWLSDRPGWFWLCGRGSVRAVTCRDILRQQSPSRASPRCQGPLCSAWRGPSAPVSKKRGGMTSPLLEMTPRTMMEAENLVFLSGRSDISLLSILVLVQNCLQTGPVHF